MAISSYSAAEFERSGWKRKLQQPGQMESDKASCFTFAEQHLWFSDARDLQQTML